MPAGLLGVSGMMFKGQSRWRKILGPMAKQIGTYRFVGKMGANVGFTNANAKKAGSAFVREKAASVSNPKTYAQARQRAKVRPVSLFFNAFVEVLNHAFLPAGRESKNMLRFRSLAMKLDGVPNVYRDENVLPFNLPYQVSEGTLGVDSLARSAQSADDNGALLFPNLLLPSTFPDDAASVAEMTIADFSQAVIAANPQLVSGEELTFLGIFGSLAEEGEQLAAHCSIVLNTGDTLTTVRDCIGRYFTIFGDGVGGEDYGRLGITSQLGAYRLCAGALIISSRTATSWRYTNSYLGMTAYGASFAVDEEAIIRSYMANTVDVTSSRILQQADNSQQQGVVPVSGSNVAYTVTTPPAGATYNYDTAAVVAMADGTRRVVVDASGGLVHYADGQFVAITQTVGSVATPLAKSASSWDGVQSISVSEVAGVPFEAEGGGITMSTSFAQPTSVAALSSDGNTLTFSEPVTFDFLAENLKVRGVEGLTVVRDNSYLVLYQGGDSFRFASEFVGSSDSVAIKTDAPSGPEGFSFYI